MRSVVLFETLGEREVEAAAQALEACYFEAGAVITRQGDEGTVRGRRTHNCAGLHCHVHWTDC